MRYQVLDLPPGKVAAFTPIPTTDNEPSAYGVIDVYGSPGIVATPAPSPMHSLPTVSARDGVNSARPSDVSPDVTFPPIYIAIAHGPTAELGPERDAGIGMARRRFCELPVPARNPQRVATSDSFVTSKGGRSAMAWPRAFQRFPTSGGV